MRADEQGLCSTANGTILVIKHGAGHTDAIRTDIAAGANAEPPKFWFAVEMHRQVDIHECPFFGVKDGTGTISGVHDAHRMLDGRWLFTGHHLMLGVNPVHLRFIFQTWFMRRTRHNRLDIATFPVLQRNAIFGTFRQRRHRCLHALRNLTGIEGGKPPRRGQHNRPPLAFGFGKDFSLKLLNLLARPDHAGAGAQFGVRHCAKQVHGNARGTHAVIKAMPFQFAGGEGSWGRAVLEFAPRAMGVFGWEVAAIAVVSGAKQLVVSHIPEINGDACHRLSISEIRSVHIRGTVVRMRAILWDMDGTLINTEPLWEQATFELSERMGRRLSPERREATIGCALRDTMAIIADWTGRELTEDLIREGNTFFHARMTELLSGSVSFRPGVEQLLIDGKKAGIPMVVVTNTQRALADICLAAMGQDYFVGSVCGNEVSNPKPARDPYIKGAFIAGVPPEEALVIEDSKTGASAGAAAGCHTLYLPMDDANVPPATSETKPAGTVIMAEVFPEQQRTNLGQTTLADLQQVFAFGGQVPLAAQNVKE